MARYTGGVEGSMGQEQQLDMVYVEAAPLVGPIVLVGIVVILAVAAAASITAWLLVRRAKRSS